MWKRGVHFARMRQSAANTYHYHGAPAFESRQLMVTTLCCAAITLTGLPLFGATHVWCCLLLGRCYAPSSAFRRVSWWVLLSLVLDDVPPPVTSSFLLIVLLRRVHVFLFLVGGTKPLVLHNFITSHPSTLYEPNVTAMGSLQPTAAELVQPNPFVHLKDIFWVVPGA